MELFRILLHFDQYLNIVIRDYGSLTYVLLFLIVFCETGLVVTPFLPGDSLLFAAGALAARTGSLEVAWLLVLLTGAAVIGDTVNYRIGVFVGPRVFARESGRFFKREHLERTQAFYERYGGKAIVLARFMPIVRTFAPFVAGVGSMRYSRFATYNVAGGIVWVALFVMGGYYFGKLRVVEENFSLVVMAIILISVLPAIVELARGRAKGGSVAQ